MPTFNDILGKHNLQSPVLYGISDRLAFPELEPLSYLELLFQTGADIVQWREKDLSAEQNRIFIRHGVELAKETNKLFFVNSLFEVAFEEGADGAHLTSRQDVGEARRVRERLGAVESLLGKSVHSLYEAELAEREGVDYIIIGPVLDPLSKESDRPALGRTALQEVVHTLSIPVIGIGGIDRPHFKDVFQTGAGGAAGITWVHEEVRALLQEGN